MFFEKSTPSVSPRLHAMGNANSSSDKNPKSPKSPKAAVSFDDNIKTKKNAKVKKSVTIGSPKDNPKDKLKKRPSLVINEKSFNMPAGQVVRGRSGINTNPPVNGDVVFILLHIANVPPLDILSESDVYATAQVIKITFFKTEYAFKIYCHTNKYI